MGLPCVGEGIEGIDGRREGRSLQPWQVLVVVQRILLELARQMREEPHRNRNLEDQGQVLATFDRIVVVSSPYRGERGLSGHAWQGEGSAVSSQNRPQSMFHRYHANGIDLSGRLDST